MTQTKKNYFVENGLNNVAFLRTQIELIKHCFDENEVDGGIAEIAVACDEDFFVAMAYVAYCITFRREVKLDDFDVSRERDKMVDFIT